MTSPLLFSAELSLFVDPTVRVEIPHLMTMPRQRGRSGVTVQFEGDDYGTAFRGLGRTGSLDLNCRYAEAEAEDRVRLLWLLDEVAPAQFDHRLLLRTHIEPGTLLPPELQEFVAGGAVVAVEVFNVVETPIVGRNWDVSFTAQIVQHTFALPEQL